MGCLLWWRMILSQEDTQKKCTSNTLVWIAVNTSTVNMSYYTIEQFGAKDTQYDSYHIVSKFIETCMRLGLSIAIIKNKTHNTIILK